MTLSYSQNFFIPSTKHYYHFCSLLLRAFNTCLLYCTFLGTKGLENLSRNGNENIVKRQQKNKLNAFVTLTVFCL